MDRRIVFLLVFATTFLSTLLVGIVALWVGQNWVRIALMSLSTMWVVGILSQILFHNLYQSVVKPLEEEKRDQAVAVQHAEINLDEVEEIEQATEMIRNAEKQEKMERLKDKTNISV